MTTTLTETPPSGAAAAPSDERAARLRWAIYAILIALSAGSITGRILALNSVDTNALEKYLKEKKHPSWQKSRPFLSANDRSRWATVRSLVELGTYEIDDIVSQPGWDTIDMVKHRGRDGEEHLYSSKPPLMATLMAGEYWIIHKLSGATLGTHPYEIGRFMLITINVIPLIVCFVMVAKLAERLSDSDWARAFVVGAAAFGTYLTTFANTINNHLIAAVSISIALWMVVRIWHDGERRARYFVLAGFFAAFTFANELPALALFALFTVALLWRAPRETLLFYMPPAMLIVAAMFGTNYTAHDSLREPYAHRSPGDDWYRYTFMRDGKERNSYWNDPKGIDRGEVDPAKYALHATVGHHGLFSLTPVWILSFAGMGMWLLRRDRRCLAAAIGLLTIVVLAFYLSRPQIDRNYGGTSTTLRWMLWFAPLWLVTMLPAAEWMSRRRVGQGVALLMLAWSAMSAAYPLWNPWTHPWLLNFFQYLGWVTL